MSQMKDLDARQELLVITMEECGELIQSCSKALRKGKLFDDAELKQELADVQAMINLMVEWDVLSWTEIEDRVERKRNKLKQWSKLIDPHPPKSEEKEKHFPSNSVTWRQSLDNPYVDEKGYGRVTYAKDTATQKMVYAHTPPYSSVSMTPLTEQEEREWERLYQAQESQKRGKENI